MKVKIFIIFIFILFILSGFSVSNTNIEDYYYVVALGIDESENGNIILSIQIAISSDDSSSESSQSTSSVIYSVEASSLNSGISICNNYLSKKLNLSHCSAIIFSEEIAKSGINSYITTLANNSEIRPTCKIIVCNTTANEALEYVSNSDENFSARLYEFIVDSADYTGYSISTETLDFLYNINSENACSTATYAVISDEALQDIGIAIFDEDKFLTNLSATDSIAYSLITNNLKTCNIEIDDPFFENETLDIIISPKENVKINVNTIDNIPYIEISNDFECSISSMNEYYNYESSENIIIIEEAINSYLENICLNFLYEVSHEYNIDICNFRNVASSKYLTTEEFEKTNWDEIYKNSNFSINITSSIEYSGLLSSE